METLTVITIVVAGVLAGNELGTWAVVHRQLAALPTPQQVAAEQALNRGYERLMPPLMIAAVAAGAVFASVVPAGAGSTPWTLAISGTICLVAMLGITLAGNVPINRATDRSTLDIDPATWSSMRARWNRLHDIRIVLDLAGFVLFICAGLAAR
ncbi:MAG TPA: DUF1772 domain-containing protein [Acidimicrobiales bacterium]|jgi:uncharacterized membrane protein|nr:DUF1772 domain-containing protein [Acidimicrobiales bacterium]